ncbi:MAG TPA: YceI family protein [Chryseolinea sp.]
MATFEIQKESSTVNWTGKKVLGLHTGTINISRGQIDISNGKVNASEVVIDMTSLTITDITDPQTLQDFRSHLWNDDFFSIETYRTAALKIQHGELVGDSEYKLIGQLTIKDITRSVTFLARIEILTDSLYSTGELPVDRTLYNIRYGSGKFIDNLGDKLIYDEFVLQFKLIGQKAN